jgi:hypothetical protein
MTLQTLDGLPQVQDQTQPITEETRDFYLDTLAKGSGPSGTFLVSDLLGASTGPDSVESLVAVNRILSTQLSNGTLSNLAAIYSNMRKTVAGIFGPPSGPIDIPSGPGAGMYASADAAISALLPLAQSAITTAASAMGSNTAILNSSFDQLATAVVTETESQKKAGIQFDDLTEDAQTPVLALILSVPSLGTTIESGFASQFFESVLDKDSVAGQALIGAMREGQNAVLLDDLGVNGYSQIPIPPTEED